MFTGIVSHIGTVKVAEDRADLRLTIDAGGMDLTTAALGASIACSGVCLTVVDKDAAAGWFAVDVSAETRRRTAPSLWQAGSSINLERALRLGDELGGHLVTGHVDGLAEVAAVATEGDSTRIDLRVARDLGRFIAPKGSVTLDGISLTVNDVRDQADTTLFTVNIIAHTADHTTMGDVIVGRRVNVEIDVLARYLQRLAAQ